ncbi:MAG: TolC family protein [Bacteroidetes bacterium]|nr:TolC family protein [Bacteroidota bacterium]MBS1757546.1 TolC family protein [Bacteroidota bacterium]
MNKQLKITSTLFIICSMLATALLAQDTKTISLREAIDLSIKNSKSLKASNARIDEATAIVKEAYNNQLPDFKVSGSYIRLSNADVSLKLGKDTSGGGNGGGSGSKGGVPKINSAVYGMANLSLPLYAGGRIKYGIESAKYLAQAASLDADNDKEAVIYNTTSAYINLYKAAAAVNIVKEDLQSSMSRDTNFSNLEKNGLLARNDLLKSQLQTSNIELSLLDAENNLKIANINMNLMLGLPENTLLSIDSNFINVDQTLMPFTDYETAALQQRKDVQALALRKKASTTGIKSAKAEAYPTIALTGGYIAANIPHLLTVTNAVNIGVGVSYNIANLWKTNTKLLQAKARATEIDANEELLNDAVKMQVNKDYQSYLLSQKKIDVYEKAIEQAKENYRITKNKYNNSLVTITDLLDADVALLQATLNSRFAKADAVLAYNKLLQTAGLLSK